jgi:superfamily I DNA/RNA helicase
VERLLLEEVDLHLETARRAPGVLVRPVRIVVPSRSLAEHLSARIARRAGRAVLGVSVRTVHAIACEILARAGLPLPAGEELFELLVRRASREAPELAALAELEDGHAVVAASVRDLLDAGLEPAHAEALDEALLAERGSRELVARARAVARLACAIARELDAGALSGLGHRSRLYRTAREILERDPQAALPSRAVLIHGFADATGVVTDLLETLVRRAGATLFLDRPPDPAEPAREDAGARFSDRFAARVLGAPPPAPEATEAQGEVLVLHAQGAWAEARAVAEELRAALDAGGLAAEELAVAARGLGAHRLALRAHLRRLGVPFSGLGEPGPPNRAGRRLADLLELLREGPRARSERWLDALELDGTRLEETGSGAARTGPRLSQTERADLRAGLLALGAARLGEVARLPTAHEGASEDLALPVRTGLAEGEDGGARAPRRRLRRALLDGAIRRADALVRRLESAQATPARRPLAERAAVVREIAHGDLGWRTDDPGASELAAALESLGAPDLALDAEELHLLLARRLEAQGRVPLGGAGGGVRVLTVTEARARTFARLWVVGLQREAFPRAVVEDPLLPDALRLRLRALLPDLPLKRDGHDEERFLFASLVAASPRVALLASSCDDDGRACEVSPLLERLRRAPHAAGPQRVPSATSAEARASRRPLPACERALLAGLHGSAREFAALLPAALEEAWREEEGGATDPSALAAGRLAVLREIDRPAHRRAPLGPFFGFAGALAGAGDPRRGAIAVTTLEGLYRCPWQTFLAKVLRVEAPPDPGGDLPAADARRLGSLVHRVLDRVARTGPGAEVETLPEATARPGGRVEWPAEEGLDALVRESAAEMLREEGIALAGFERVLAFAAREPLALARELDLEAARSGFELVGTELHARLRVAGAAGAARELALRVDRADRRRGLLRLTDYKTGKPKLAQVDPKSRRAALLEAVGSGELLQGPAYAALAGELASGAGVGRYLYLRPDAREPAREVAIEAGDAEVGRAFAGAVRRALAAWDAGSFFPRLVEGESDREPNACRSCELKEACLRGDSSARGRLWRFGSDPPAGLGAAEAALVGLLRREAAEP